MDATYESLWSLAGLILAALLALVPANIARDKGRTPGRWYVYGFFFFTIAIIHALLMKPTPDALARQAERRRVIAIDEGGLPCPGCGEYMRPEIETCGLCGADMKATPLVA